MWIILPVKDLRRSKTRLARWLSPGQRSDLMRAMVEDVLEELGRAQKVSGVLVVSTEPSLHELADQYGARCIAFDDDSTLNQAVGAACEHLARRGQTSCMIVHGDLPLLRAERIDLLIAEASRNQTILVPCKDRQGTNLLALALRVLSKEMRNTRLMVAETKAARLPAIMTIPMIIFILPTLFVVLLGPASMDISDGFRDILSR